MAPRICFQQRTDSIPLQSVSEAPKKIGIKGISLIRSLSPVPQCPSRFFWRVLLFWALARHLPWVGWSAAHTPGFQAGPSSSSSFLPVVYRDRRFFCFLHFEAMPKRQWLPGACPVLRFLPGRRVSVVRNFCLSLHFLLLDRSRRVWQKLPAAASSSPRFDVLLAPLGLLCSNDLHVRANLHGPAKASARGCPLFPPPATPLSTFFKPT